MKSFISFLLILGSVRAGAAEDLRAQTELSNYPSLSSEPAGREIVYCSTSAVVALEEASRLMQSRLERVKQVLLEQPDEYIWTSIFGAWMKRSEIAAGLRVSQSVKWSEREGYGTDFWTYSQTRLTLSSAQGYSLDKVIQDLAPRSGVSLSQALVQLDFPADCQVAQLSSNLEIR